MSFWAAAYAILWKDLRAELRTREMAGISLVFALLAILTFSFAFDPTRLDARAMLPGVLWVTVFFSGILGLGRSMASERAGETFSGLLASPVEAEAVFAGKLAANLAFAAAVEAVCLPVLFALFRVTPGAGTGWLVGVVALGTLGFVAVGTLVAAMAASTRASELLLPLLLLPVAVPAAIASVEATGSVLAGVPAAEWAVWLKLLAAYDVLMLALPPLLFRYLLEG